MSRLASKLVKIMVDEAVTKDDLGVHIQEEWQAVPPTGRVVDVAADVTVVKTGERVFFERYSALPHPDDKNLRLVREDSILEVLDEKPESI